MYLNLFTILFYTKKFDQMPILNIARHDDKIKIIFKMHFTLKAL
jgi:hypothetical protein